MDNPFAKALGLSPIHANRYSTYLSRVFSYDEYENFRIEKETLADGTIIRSYDPQTCRMLQGVMKGDLEIVILNSDSQTWMSDTPMEQESMRPVLRRARGDVLICGLGLGMVPLTLLMVNKKVKSITIVEESEEVIELVWPKVRRDRLSIVHEDCFDYAERTNRKFSYIYVDIWPCTLGPYEDMERIHQVFNPLLVEGGKCDVWLQEMYDVIGEKLPKEPVLPGIPGMYPPCLTCGKTFRNDYAGLCMDCADTLGVSEMFLRKKNNEGA